MNQMILIMKMEYRQVIHLKTEKGWQPLPYPGPRVKLHPEDAAARNRHFDEHGVRLEEAHPKKSRHLMN